MAKTSAPTGSATSTTMIRTVPSCKEAIRGITHTLEAPDARVGVAEPVYAWLRHGARPTCTAPPGDGVFFRYWLTDQSISRPPEELTKAIDGALSSGRPPP